MNKLGVPALCLWAAFSPAETVTYSKHVAPILYKNCTTCHRPGEIAPMSLLTYKEARPWAKSIREKVVERVMPPWHADPRYGKFGNERRLSQQEIDTIVAWVEGGARQGDPKNLPRLPEYTEGWHLGKPDVVLSMEEEYQVQAEGVVEYQHFVVPTNFTEDRWVQAAEIRPGNRKVVHHVIVYVQPPAGRTTGGIPALQIRREEAVPVGEREAVIAGRRVNRGRLGAFLVGTAPGDQATVFPPGAGKRIWAGSNLIFQVHYTPNGAAAKDRTRLGLFFAKEPPEREIRTAGVQNARFVIPPGEASYRVDSSATFIEDGRIWGLFPHMHFRGKSFEYRLVYPDGNSQVILAVPRYDFNWQTWYRPAEPLAVPKGSRLECVAYFDNSPKNRYNPDPTKEVRWGDQTWEEMMIGFMDFTVDKQPLRQTASAEARGR